MTIEQIAHSTLAIVRATELRSALGDIVLRCDEGNSNTDWLPVIRNIAAGALANTADAADEIGRLQAFATSEYKRGLEAGSSCQAILEIHGRDRFLAELKTEQDDKIERLQGDIIRLEHIVAVLQTAIGQAHLSATTIEDHTRIRNGRLEVWCLGEWRDVEDAEAEAGVRSSIAESTWCTSAMSVNSSNP